MTLEERVEQLINEHLPLLEISKVLDTNEAYRRGAAVLSAQTELTRIWKEYADQSIQAKAEQEQAWHLALTTAEGKTVGDREAAAKANVDYQASTSKLELLKNNLVYTQSFIKQFDAGFRLLSYMIKGDIGV